MHRFPSLTLKSRIDAAVGSWRSAGGTISLCRYENYNRTRTSLPLQPLQAGHSSLRQRKLESDAEIRCRKQPTPRPSPSTRSITRCRRVLPWMFYMGTGTKQVRQWRQKRMLMRPEAAFPYVSAAEGAQHPPKKPPCSTALTAAPAQKPSRSTVSRNENKHKKQYLC